MRIPSLFECLSYFWPGLRLVIGTFQFSTAYACTNIIYYTGIATFHQFYLSLNKSSLFPIFLLDFAMCTLFLLSIDCFSEFLKVFETAKFFVCVVGQFNAKAVNFPVLNSYFF